MECPGGGRPGFLFRTNEVAGSYRLCHRNTFRNTLLCSTKPRQARPIVIRVSDAGSGASNTSGVKVSAPPKLSVKALGSTAKLTGVPVLLPEAIGELFLPEGKRALGRPAPS